MNCRLRKQCYIFILTSCLELRGSFSGLQYEIRKGFVQNLIIIKIYELPSTQTVLYLYFGIMFGTQRVIFRPAV
jgi:hypothetical protein